MSNFTQVTRLVQHHVYTKKKSSRKVEKEYLETSFGTIILKSSLPPLDFSVSLKKVRSNVESSVGLVQLPLPIRTFTNCSAVELPGFEGATWSSRERVPS